MMAQKYLEWTQATSGIVRTRTVCARLVALKPRSAQFYESCIALELSEESVNQTVITRLFEAAIDSDRTSMRKFWYLCAHFLGTWLSYIQFRMKHAKEANSITQLCWRATKEVSDKDEFIRQYEALKFQ